jgi:single stranded DNA-binding protein
MNTVSFTGHLGNAPRTRQLVSGTPVCDFDIAVNRRFTQNGQVVEQTTWVNVTAWRGLAQTCAQYLEKGRHVLVTGRLEAPDAYLDQRGQAAGTQPRHGDHRSSSWAATAPAPTRRPRPRWMRRCRRPASR